MNNFGDPYSLALRWMQRLDFCRDLRGHTVDLDQLSQVLPFEGFYREMVLLAAASILRKNGAEVLFGDQAPLSLRPTEISLLAKVG